MQDKAKEAEKSSSESFVESIIKEVQENRQTGKYSERNIARANEEVKQITHRELKVGDDESEDLDYIPSRQRPELADGEESVLTRGRVFNINVSHDYADDLEDYPYDLKEEMEPGSYQTQRENQRIENCYNSLTPHAQILHTEEAPPRDELFDDKHA